MYYTMMYDNISIILHIHLRFVRSQHIHWHEIRIPLTTALHYRPRVTAFGIVVSLQQ